MDGMMIPFILLLIITIALLLERKYHEDKIVDIYEKKFKEWKQHSSNDKQQGSPKELKGLIFKQGYNISLELFDDKIKDPIERKKYTIITKDKT
jgi:hypothetical protein